MLKEGAEMTHNKNTIEATVKTANDLKQALTVMTACELPL